MGKESGVEAVKSEMEDGEVEAMADDENVSKIDKGGKVDAILEDESGREGVGESGKERPKDGGREKEGENRADQEVSRGTPWSKVEKKESREVQENIARDGKENGNANESEEEEGATEAEAGQDGDEEEAQNSETEDDGDEEAETPARIEEDEEKSREEEEERKEAEKDLALTMSSPWAPMGEMDRDRDGAVRSSLKVGSKSGRDEMDIEIGSYREVQSEGFKERGRTREEDGEHSKEKSRQKKQRLEPPLLSLSLPDTSLHLASDPGQKVKSKSSNPVPTSSDNERSFRSMAQTQSQSNGYTNSLSLSLCHPFFHNPSCSLTQNSLDDKEGTTCSSRQVASKHEGTQGSHDSCQVSYSRDQALHGNHLSSEGSRDRSKNRREPPLYQRLLQNGSPQFLQGSVNNEGTRDSQRSFMDERVYEGSQGGLNRAQSSDQYRWKDDAGPGNAMERSRTSHDRNWSIHKDKCERHVQEGWSPPTRSASFQERNKLLDRERRLTDPDGGRDLSLSGSRGFLDRDEESTGPEKSAGGIEEDSTVAKNSRKVERIWLHEIVSEPIVAMAQKLQRVPDAFLESLRRCLQDMIASSKKREDFVNLRRTLQRRKDLSTETLFQSHRTQLEIMVALKTGIPAFLHPEVPLTTGEMAEIILGTKCRNVACKNQLPADDCECKVCSQMSGFCNACMCVVCYKFDFDSNTCRWIGCDYCLHWCHSDCGIQMGYISSGISSQGSSENAVMLFRCIGCGHTSELYGFVKDVFISCAKEWNEETFSAELECVRRIFHRSDDLLGKQLFGRAEQLLVKLKSSGDLEGVCNSMLKFLDEHETPKSAPRPGAGAEAVVVQPRDREMTSRLADAVREAIHVMKSPNNEGTDLEKARAALQFLDHEVEEKRAEASELHYERSMQKSQIDELESIVQIKQAEAKMFQMRADEVRREAEGLQRIVQAKNEKIEEEYKAKLLKLQLTEVEERRRKWYEEVQVMEKAQREYSAMKMSMVSDIRELLKKMEANKAQIS